MAFTEYKVNPEFYNNKLDILENKVIKFVSSVYFKGRLEEVEQMKAKLDVLQQEKGNREETGQVETEEKLESESEGNKFCYIVSKEKVTENISEGLITLNQIDYSMSLSDVRYLMSSFPNLKWTFFFVCEPFWKDVKKEDLNRSVVCVAYSRSGVPVADHYRVSLKYDSMDDCLWVKERSVITATKDGYTFPFKKDWNANAYVFDRDGKKFLRSAGTCGFLEKVETHKDMYKAYKRNMARYNSAMRSGSFYEAMLIDYGLIEDITFEFLYHLGIFQDSASRSTNQNIKDQILYVVNQNPEVTTPWENIKVGQISQKLMIMKSLARWTQKDIEESDPVPEGLKNDAYLEKLMHTMKYCDLEHIIDTCDYILWWLKYRNEIMHAMMKTNVYSMDAEIEDIAKEGKKYFRELEKEKNSIKKGKLRKFLKMND